MTEDRRRAARKSEPDDPARTGLVKAGTVPAAAIAS